MKVCVLGPVEVWSSRGRIEPLTPQARRLLAVLTVAPGRIVSRDRIAEYAVGGSLDGATVRTAVSRLRKVLGDRVVTESSGYRLELAAGDEFDAAKFERLVADAGMLAPAERLASLRKAIGLWRGPAFDDFADEPWVQGTATRLEELRAVATEDLAVSLIDVGEHREAVSLLEAHLVGHTHRERPVGLLMQALASAGRVAEALRVFQRFRAGLREIGLEPTSELRSLEAQLLRDSDTEPSADTNPTSRPPTGTLTFLVAAIEESASLWQRDELAMSVAMASHDELIRVVVESHSGWVFKTAGDDICAAFTSATQAAKAAREAQQRSTLNLRIGVHTGEAELRNGVYRGPVLNRAARIANVGHPGQILLSSAAASLTDETELSDVGEHQLPGIAGPVQGVLNSLCEAVH